MHSTGSCDAPNKLSWPTACPLSLAVAVRGAGWRWGSYVRCMKTKVMPASFLVFTLFSGCTTSHREPTEFERELAAAFRKEPGECIPRSWLVEELSVDAIVLDRRVTPEVLRMVHTRQAADRIFFYRSPPKTWAALLGQGGFAIVRDGRPVECVMTVVN